MLNTFRFLGATLALLLAGTARVEGSPTAVAVDCDPPLTRAAADAYLGIIVFMASVVQAFDLGTPPVEIQDQFARELSATYCSGTEEERAYVATAPDRLIVLRNLWPELDEVRRAQLRDTWRAQLAP